MKRLGNIIIPVLMLVPLAVEGRQTPPRKGRPGAQRRAAPASQSYPNLRTQAITLAEAFDRRDFARLVSLTYPKLVEVLGGPEKMVLALNREARQVEPEGTFPTTTVVGEPHAAVRIGRQLFAVVPTALRIKVPEGVLVGDSFLLAISEDGGDNWTFLDGSATARTEQMKVLLPQAVGKLKLPESKPPVLEREP